MLARLGSLPHMAASDGMTIDLLMAARLAISGADQQRPPQGQRTRAMCSPSRARRCLPTSTTPLLGVVCHGGDRTARRCDAAWRRGDGDRDLRLPVLAVRLPAHGHVAFTAQALGARQPQEFPLILLRGFMIAGVDRRAADRPAVCRWAHVLFGLMGGSEGVTSAAQAYFAIRIFAAPVDARQLRRPRLAGRSGARPLGAGAAGDRSISSAWRLTFAWCSLPTGASQAPPRLRSIAETACGLILGVVLARRLLRRTASREPLPRCSTAPVSPA